EFRRVGLPTPEYRLASSEAELLQAVEALGYPDRPVVVKPPRSNGMRGVRILRENSWDVMRFLSEKPSGLEVSLDELVAILRRGEMWPALVVMEYLPGDEYTVDVYRGVQGTVAIPRKRVTVRS